MKIFFKITIFSINLFIASKLSAQSFVKDDRIIEAGFGLGIYDTKIYQKSNNNKEENRAAAWVFPLSFEYAYHKRLAIGMGYKYSSFITGNDSVNKNENMNGHDIVLKPTFHIIKSKTVNMYVGALAGIAWVNYQVNDAQKASAKGSGSILAFIFGTRFYVSKKIALCLNYSFNSYNFDALTVSNNQGYYDQLDLKLNRGNVGLGLAYKFKKK
jgi:opacity protein-like surface antigen